MLARAGIVGLVGVVASAHAIAAELDLPAELPLGRPGLSETRETQTLAPGLTHTTITRGDATLGDHWLVETAPTADRDAAMNHVNALETSGIAARLERAHENADDGTPIYLARAGWFEERDAAEALAAEVEATVGSASVRSLADVGAATDGPWLINILAVDLEAFAGEVDFTLAQGLAPGAATVQDMAGDALAAVNSGFFVYREEWGGTTGRPAGLFVEAGQLAAETIDGRPALRIAGDEAHVLADVVSTISATIGEADTRRIDGINRKPGRAVNCGNPGDVQGEVGAHDYFCDDPDEIILFTSLFGTSSDKGDGVEIVVEDNLVTAVNDARGADIPENGFTLQTTGEDAAWLQEAASVDAPASYAIELTTSGEPLALDDATELVGGGPTLLTDGTMPPVEQRAHEGWSRNFGEEDRTGFYYGWVVRRHPRTAAGISEDGTTLYLATVDGRQPGVSVGATITEMATLMRAIGADDAINLDGGGSTSMVVEGTYTNRPSGDEPRGVSDAIVFTAQE